MKNNKLIVLIGVGIVIAIIAGVIANRSTKPVVLEEDASVAAAPTQEEIRQFEEQKAALAPAAAAERYTHPTYGFSFEKPAGYSVGAIPNENGGQTLVVQPTSGDVKRAFQIFISPSDEPVTFTAEELKPFLLSAKTVISRIVAGDKAPGVMFKGNNDAFGGASYEIWFYFNGNLYQISSYVEFASQLQQIIGTWRF